MSEQHFYLLMQNNEPHITIAETPQMVCVPYIQRRKRYDKWRPCDGTETNGSPVMKPIYSVNVLNVYEETREFKNIADTVNRVFASITAQGYKLVKETNSETI